MISVQEAKQQIEENTSAGKIISLDLYAASSYVNATDIMSPMNFPSFRQSAMDGYAFRFEDWNRENTFFVEREIQAGNSIENSILKHGEAIRIFTGAKVPDDADTVVIQEHVVRDGNQLKLINTALPQGSNIRAIASQSNKGDCILKKGNTITPGAAALIAGLGIEKIEVFQKPSCIILTTGKELIKSGSALINGQIYESNSFALFAGLKKIGLDVNSILSVDDDESEIKEEIEHALEKADVLLITGGVSVGDYDFVAKELAKNGVKKIFHTVKQKPGKPLYFGTKGGKIIFGLPGNPGSVLTCFYEYVVPCLRMKMGMNEPDLLSLKLPVLNDIYKKPGLTHFVKGKIKIDGVDVLDHQESYKMNAFAEADCLIMIDEESEHIRKGEMVTIHLFNV